MPNHVHLLVSPRDELGLAKTMQSLGRRYVRHMNLAYGRSGTMWEGRYRAALIEPGHCFLACMRYIELNPVRATLVQRPGDYRWSSYRANALGEYDPLVTPHVSYRSLGPDAARQQQAYESLFADDLDQDFVSALRAATNGGWPFGGCAFKAAVAQALNRRVEPLPRGRPPKFSAA
jgi:putative transposase